MPSKPPPARSALWAVIIPVALMVAGIAWALSSFGSTPQNAPPQGVHAAARI